MPHTEPSHAHEIIATAMQRIGNRLLQAAAEAQPYSQLRTAAAMGAVLVHLESYSIVTIYEVQAARELIREINDVLEVAPNESRDALRRARLHLEEVIDKHEWQIENHGTIEARQSIRDRVAARKTTLDAQKSEG